MLSNGKELLGALRRHPALRRVRAHLETQQRPQEEQRAISLLQLPLPLKHGAEPGLLQQEISAGGADRGAGVEIRARAVAGPRAD